MKLRHALMAFTASTALFAGSAHAAELPYPIDGDSNFNWKSYHDFADKYDLSGQTLSIFGPWLTADKEGFEKVLAYFEEATGAKIENSGSDSFEQQIVIDTQAGSPANIAIFPQPGLAADGDGVRPDREEGRVAQGDLAAEAHEQVEPETDDGPHQHQGDGEVDVAGVDQGQDAEGDGAGGDDEDHQPPRRVERRRPCVAEQLEIIGRVDARRERPQHLVEIGRIDIMVDDHNPFGEEGGGRTLRR